jgi:hypothetical protein
MCAMCFHQVERRSQLSNGIAVLCCCVSFPVAYYHHLFVKDNPKMCLQMTCISSKSAQALQPMNPVALGLAPGGSFFPDSIDPTTSARLQEQRQAFFQHQWQQQQAFMAMLAQHQGSAASKEGSEGDEETGASGNATESKGDEDQKPTAGEQPNHSAAMMAFQQQQQHYYAMFMTQQQHMAAMAAQQQALGLSPSNGSIGADGEPAAGGEPAGDASETAKEGEREETAKNGNETNDV